MKLLTVKLENDQLVFSDGFTRAAAKDEEKLFVNRSTLKAIQRDSAHEIFPCCEIHRHSGYSLLDGCISPQAMASKSKIAGAITDHGNMSGVLQFYSEMKKQNKIPIVGEEFYMVNDVSDEAPKSYHLILLAKNQQGYKNLVALSSESYNHIYKKPLIDYKLLEKYHEGLVCTSACIGGELSQSILKNYNDNNEETRKDIVRIIKWFKNLFKDDFYIEIQRHNLDDEAIVNPRLIALANKFKIKLVAGTDAHYLNKEDALAQEVLLCINSKKKYNEPHFKFDGTGYHVHSDLELVELFKDIPESLDSTVEIAEKCSGLEIETGKYYLPEFNIPPEYKNADDYLYALARNGFTERYKAALSPVQGESKQIIDSKNKLKAKYWARLKYELSVIKKMGFAGYFLIVRDFLDYIKNEDVSVGPGRGSGAGSIVLYCLHITEIDPFDYDLLFERFLNPDRISMPDIDSDISKCKRYVAIDYVNEKYGEDHVSHIVAYGTLAAKNVIVAVSKVFGYTPTQAQQISNLIPDEPKMTLKKAIEKSPEFKAWTMKNDPIVQKIITVAKTLEGTPKNIGTHACGICISKDPIVSYLPTMKVVDKKTKETFITTQYDKDECELCGVLKMDFLGLRTIDTIDLACNEVNSWRKRKISIDSMNLHDINVYKLFATGKTDGIFQFESEGMKDLLVKMFSDVGSKPVTDELLDEYFARLVAATALFRPGPMDEIPNYLASLKTGKINYDHPLLESILKDTYGIFIYQEQVMHAVRKLAGFTAGQSDKIRKAMGKKIESILNEYGEYFIKGSAAHDAANPSHALNIAGCVANGISEETAKTIWDKMKKFGEYAFNKSHAAAYTVNSFRTAWLANYFPVEFLTATLNSLISDSRDKFIYYICCCRKQNISLLSPDVNHSKNRFSLDIDKNGKKAIRFGFEGIKEIGAVPAANLLSERETNGKFTSLDDFLIRMSKWPSFGKKVLNALAVTGALDCFEGTRKAKIAAVPIMLEYIDILRTKNGQENVVSKVFGPQVISFKLPRISGEYSVIQEAELEEEYLGTSVIHPISCFKNVIDSYRNDEMYSTVTEIKQMPEEKNGTAIYTIGVIKEKEISSYQKKNGQQGKILKLLIDDGFDTLKCVAFDSDASKFSVLFSNNQIAHIAGNLKIDSFGSSCMLKQMKNLTPFAESV